MKMGMTGHSADGIPVQRSALLAQYPGIVHGMSTTVGGVSPAPYLLNCSTSVGDVPENVAENRRRFAAALGLDPGAVAFTRQIHSDTIIRVEAPGTYESCDALLTNRKGTGLAISIADCIPILLFDRVTGTIGAVHAGWRGSRDRIIVKAIDRMGKEYGVRPGDLAAYVGPSAGVCCYEVGEEVASIFGEKYSVRKEGGKPHIDLKAWNRMLLEECGLRGENIDVAGECTICSGGKFHSYRRDGARSGRMLAIIGLRM
jgi:polyphenol oxidase